MKVFVDANIFLDYYFDGRDNLLPLGEVAFNFFRTALSGKYVIVISNEVIVEVASIMGVGIQKAMTLIFAELIRKKIIEVVYALPLQKFSVAKISRERRVPFNDALYRVIASDIGIPVVSRDRHFHETLSDLVESFKPEELV